MSKTGTAIAYDYGADGYRISKAVTEGGTTTYQYFYSGGKLLHVSWNESDRVHIFYNAIGSPISILYNGTRYYYVRNAQGDIVGLTNTSGVLKVAYTYDAWGKPLTTTGSMASTLGQVNPLRYRGYVYDSETGLYYLGSRYYDPDVGRFINADEYITSEQGFSGLGVFIYCKNNPTNNYDSLGEWTYGVSIGGNITDYAGIYLSIGYFIDGYGNKEIQISYAIPFDNDTWVIGSESIGTGMTIQWTEADTVFDLHGTSMVFGVGGGIDGYAAGYDYIFIEDELDYQKNRYVHQMTMGIGIGEDMHVMRVKTVPASLVYEKVRPVFDVIKECFKIAFPFKMPLIWKRRQPHNGMSHKPSPNYVY